MTNFKNNIEEVIFPNSESVGPRDWGEESLLVLAEKKYSLKKICIKAGKKGGLQYHHKKDESGYLVSGSLKIRYDDGNGLLKERVLKAGDFFHFKPGQVHQEEALSDCVIIEASTPHFNDRVRVEEQYCVEAEAGLESTKVEDVEFR